MGQGQALASSCEGQQPWAGTKPEPSSTQQVPEEVPAPRLLQGAGELAELLGAISKWAFHYRPCGMLLLEKEQKRKAWLIVG